MTACVRRLVSCTLLLLLCAQGHEQSDTHPYKQQEKLIHQKELNELIQEQGVSVSHQQHIEEKNEVEAWEVSGESEEVIGDAYSHFTRAVRYLMGSNCVLIERGVVPIYEQCYGCSMREAYSCLQDMRNNVTGNVPVGCHIEAISEKPDTSCCPTFVNLGNGAYGPVIFESSAYPMAMECLREIGCEDTEMFTDLLAECYHVCDGVKNLWGNDIFFTCTAIPSPASSLTPGALLVSACLTLLLALQVLV